MRPLLPALLLMTATAFSSPLDPAAATPPMAERRIKIVGLHGDRIEDPYFWLREKENPQVLDYLKAENAYTDAVMAPVKGLEEHLYTEMLARVQQTDSSALYPQRGWWLYTRTEEGKQYPIFCRRHGRPEAPEEIVLDLNRLAEGHPFMAVGNYEFSDDNLLLAWTSDTDGHRDYDFHLTELATGQEIATPLAKVADVAWAADNRTLFYITEDEAKRSCRLWRWTLGTREPALLYEEKDELFGIHLHRSRDGRYVFCGSHSSRTTEYRFLPADRPEAEWQVIAPRRNEIKYYPEHRDGVFYLRTNDGAREFRVMTVPAAQPGAAWAEFLPEQAHATITDFDAFARHAIVVERAEGLVRFQVLDFATRQLRLIELPEPAYQAYADHNAEFETDLFRFRYESPITPSSVYSYKVTTGERELLKRTPVLGGYDPALYVVDRLHVPAKDGAKIPLDVIRRRDVPLDGTAPCWLYGYGSYGLSIDPSFSIPRLSLLGRGVIYAIAHIRGGGELGEAWHDAARMMTKMNTFTDFIACGDFLVAQRYTGHERLFIQGGSAGGLLIGATLNLRPDLARAALLDVPFVDVLNTMSDATLPLTTGEYIEWGNPNIPEEYRYIKSYSPYDNIHAAAYPTVLLYTSLHDSQVPYWEPAKFTAKLRAVSTGKNPILFKINLAAGHGGSSGRYDRYREVAFEYAFGLSALGVGETP